LLRDFVATAPACGVPVESKIVDTTTGFAACDFTQSIGAELLVRASASTRMRQMDRNSSYSSVARTRAWWSAKRRPRWLPT